MIRIVADTMCSLPVKEMLAKGIFFVPQIVNFETESYEDDYGLSAEAFLEKLKIAPKIPSTAAPPPSRYGPIFRQALEAGDELIVITPSQKLSGTYRSASVAASEFDSSKIRIVDTGTLAGGLGQIVLFAKKLADAGENLDSIEAAVKEMASRERILALVSTLEYLYKGGRIGTASKLVGSLLQIKPILTIVDGVVAPFDKVRTLGQAKYFLINKTLEYIEGNPMPCISVSDGGAKEDSMQIVRELEAKSGGIDVPLYEAPPAIVVHSGPGLILVSSFRKA